MAKTVIIQDESDYYNDQQINITDKVLSKNVIIAVKMSETEFEDKHGINVDKYVLKKLETRHLINTDKGKLFFDEETGERILLCGL